MTIVVPRWPTLPCRNGIAGSRRTSGSATHALIGTGCIVLPGVTIGESSCVGAGSLVKVDVAPFDMVAGVPARVIGQRRTQHRALAANLLREEKEEAQLMGTPESSLG